MQQRLDNVQTQLQTLQSRYQICQKENEKRMKLLEQSTDAIKMVEEENYKLIREKGKIKAESDIYKESLGTLQLKCTLLEEKNKTLEKDISTVKEEYFIYKSYTEKIEEKLIKETEQARLYYDENKYLADGYKSLEEDKELISKQLKHCENSLSDLQSQLAVIRTEKDLFQEELNGEKLKLQDINTSKEELLKENTQLQKKINTLQYDANTKELAISSYKNDYRKLEEEYSAVKKVCEDLSGELCTLKASYEEKMEKLNLLESNTSLVIQEHQLIQKERWDLEKTVKQLNESLESKKHDHLNEREKQEEIIDKLKTEIDHKDESWSQLKGRCHHLDQELVKTKEKLTHSVSNQKEELFGWKNTCERLTEALNRKENEIQTLTDRCRDLDETTLQLKLEIHSYKDQISTLRSQQQLFHRLKEENRRLLKEKVENEQLIKLLETEKEVLTKNTNREIKCSQRDLAKMEQDLDHANQVNQELKVANEVLTDKINSSQNENQELKEALTESSKMVSAEDHDGLNVSHKDLLVEYKQLKEAYLRLVDKEESSQNVNDLSNQLGDINTELERLKVENENLLSQKQKWEATQTTDVDSCRLELEQTKEELEQQRVANELLKKELKDREQNQSSNIEESLADVDKDLQQMRQELHQLMGVIRNKDQEIENLGSQLKSSQSQIQTCEETIQQLKTSLNDLKSKEPVDAPVTATTNSSTMAPLTINTDKTTSSKENGDVFSPLEPVAENENSLKQIMEDYPSVTLRSASVTDSLSSVDAASKSSDVPLSPNSDRLHSLIAKYRNPGDAPASPDRGRVSGRPHSIGPGSSFSGMSRILGLTTPKPFYLSSGGAKFNRMSGTSSALSGGPSSTSSEPGTDLPPLATSTTSSMPSSSFLQSVNSKGELTKTSPSSFPKSPPVPPPRPASRPSSVHSPVQDVQAVALNGNTETRSASPKLLPKPQQRQQQQQPQQQPKEQQPEPESVANNDIEEVRANMIVDV
ncbi:sporulation-specific protein 15 [Octopus sinensis]|uniref:Sporulation-specific protein 15 n=1 Tax=Octopus sinensis TaxID=2607531 RepID=A0A6P7S481_9MOLL|nr:sporulation-specific protein 15 [Octopus sinensis]